MERFAPVIELVIGVTIGAVLILFANPVTTVTAPTGAKVARLSIVPTLALPSIPLPSFTSQEPTTTPPAPAKAAASKQTASAQSSFIVPSIVLPPLALPVAPTPETASSTEELEAAAQPSLYLLAAPLRATLVNIICLVPPESPLHSISGSGIMIDSKGVILTNAHIAQYFLLTDHGARCRIRTGSPAADTYRAALLYISPPWLRANSQILTDEAPTGTGEYDFALLAVTESTSGAALPTIFPHQALASEAPLVGDSIIIGSYGAQFLRSDQIRSALFPTIVFGSVQDIFTFAFNTVDVIELGGSLAAQEGSSGGGVLDSSGKVVATLTTSTMDGDTSTRSLHAITAPYIRAQYEREAGHSLDALLAQPPISAAANFATKASALESIITSRLP